MHSATDCNFWQKPKVLYSDGFFVGKIRLNRNWCERMHTAVPSLKQIHYYYYCINYYCTTLQPTAYHKWSKYAL